MENRNAKIMESIGEYNGKMKMLYSALDEMEYIATAYSPDDTATDNALECMKTFKERKMEVARRTLIDTLERLFKAE